MNQKLVNAINEQLNFEFESAHVYLAMQSNAVELGLEGLAHWMGVQYEEEVFHARKFMNYLYERGSVVEIQGFPGTKFEFSSILDILKTALEHEKLVTKKIHNIMDIAHEIKDYATISFLNWYIDEQVEEEDTFSGLIDKVELLDGNGIYMLDQELLTRVFIPPVKE